LAFSLTFYVSELIYIATYLEGTLWGCLWPPVVEELQSEEET